MRTETKEAGTSDPSQSQPTTLEHTENNLVWQALTDSQISMP